MLSSFSAWSINGKTPSEVKGGSRTEPTLQANSYEHNLKKAYWTTPALLVGLIPCLQH